MRQVVLVAVGFGIAFSTAYWISLPGAQPRQGNAIEVAAALSPERQGARVDGVVRDVLSRGFTGWETSSSQTGSLTALVEIIDLVNESVERQSGAGSLDSEFLAELLERWANGNDSSALSQMSTIEQPAIRRATAVLLVALRQFDDRSTEEVLASVPAAEQAYLFAEVLAAQAADSPERALDAVASSKTALLRRLGMRRVAESMVRNNSEVVFDHVSDIDDLALRSVYVTAAVTALARKSPDMAFDFIDSGLSGEVPVNRVVLQALAQVNPEAVFDLAERAAGSSQGEFERAAIEGLAYQDPERAFAKMQSLQAWAAREELFALIARAYVRLDDRAAWEWAAELGSDYRAKVFDEIGIGDSDYAARLLRIELERDELDIDFLSVALESSGDLLSGTIPSVQFPDLLAKLTDREGEAVATVIQLLLAQWRIIDPEDAIVWAYSNPNSVPDSLLDDLAGQVALSDLAEAARVMNSLPEEHQADWMSGVAQAVALRDLQGATTWLASYESLPGYEDAVVRAFDVGVNQFGFVPDGLPEEASPMLETYSTSVRRRVLMGFTTAWSRQDPVKALDWAMQVEMSPDTEVHRRDAIRYGMAQFVAQDAAAAREWALELPPGRSRDAAIRSFVVQSEQTADYVLLDQIEDHADRLRTATTVAGRLWAQGDREEAISLLETHIPDESERDRVYAQISAQGLQIVIN